MNKKLKRLFAKGSDFFRCKIPIMGGAMTWISESNLVSATSNAGFWCNSSWLNEQKKLEQEILKTRLKTQNLLG